MQSTKKAKSRLLIVALCNILWTHIKIPGASHVCEDAKLKPRAPPALLCSSPPPTFYFGDAVKREPGAQRE